MARFGEYDSDFYKVYVLALEGGKYYVGITKEPYRRLAEHLSGKGASFTHRYKPLGIVYTKKVESRYKDEAEVQERRVTIDLMKRYGIENVRGGEFYSRYMKNVKAAMSSALYCDIRSSYNPNYQNKIYRCIDENREALLGARSRKEVEKINDAVVESINASHKKRRKVKPKADFWWENWKKAV